MAEIFGVQYEDLGPVVETVETADGASPVTIIRRKGLCRYIDCGREVLADAATFCDYGKQGVSRSYTRHRETDADPEQREKNRAMVRMAIVTAMQRQGLW